LDNPVQAAVQARLSKVAEEAESVKHFARSGKLTGLYKLRAYGKYRVIYRLQPDQKLVIVLKIGDRDDIYKD